MIRLAPGMVGHWRGEEPDFVSHKHLSLIALACLLMVAPALAADSVDIGGAPPVVSTDVSLITLFWQAHWVAQSEMLGLFGCSVWVWAIAIDKMLLYSRTKRAMDRFEQAFWSGES